MLSLSVMFAYGFMSRALLVGAAVGILAALLGLPLVLRHDSMLTDGLSHLGFGVVTLAVACGLAQPLWLALPAVAVGSLWLLHLNEHSRLHPDTAVALISATALATGVAVTSLTSGLSVDTCNFLFGSLLSLTPSDVILSLLVCAVMLLLLLWYRRPLFTLTLDRDFAAAAGLSVRRYQALTAICTGLLIVIGMRLLGVMLIGSLLIFPAASGLQISRSYGQIQLWGILFNLLSIFLGLVFSFILNASTGAVIVLVEASIFLCCWCFRVWREAIW